MSLEAAMEEAAGLRVVGLEARRAEEERVIIAARISARGGRRARCLGRRFRRSLVRAACRRVSDVVMY